MASSIAEEAEHYVIQRIREAYPFMNIDAVNEIGKKCYGTIATGIENE